MLDGQKASNCTSFSMLEEDVAATNVQCSCSTSFVTLKISELGLSLFLLLTPVGYYSAVYYLQANPGYLAVQYSVQLGVKTRVRQASDSSRNVVCHIGV